MSMNGNVTKQPFSDVESMTATDPVTGKAYMIAYSLKVQQQVKVALDRNTEVQNTAIQALQKNEWLFRATLFAVLCLCVVVALLLFNTGLVGNYLSKAVC